MTPDRAVVLAIGGVELHAEPWGALPTQHVHNIGPKRYTDQHNLLRVPEHDVFSGIAQYTRYITVRAREKKGESKPVHV